ncbi:MULTISPECIES: hypothetical protein [unclassified Streptomyces]|uniref:hypothetical protein n=1 Tax=unclassified Streptomyces TaxID=2593676 RepID=UPI0035D5E5B4
MSGINPMEQAGGQVAQTAAVALQVLVLTARALSETSRREVPNPSPQQTLTQQPADPDHVRYAHMVRGIMQPPAVAEAMVNAPQWPQLAGELKKLESEGVNVSQFLSDAAPLIERMHADMQAGSPTPGVAVGPATNLRDPWAESSGRQRDEFQKPEGRVRGALSKLFKRGPDESSVLGERKKELARLGIGPQENSRLVVVAREALADEGLLAQMVVSREWPRIASQMRALQGDGHDPRRALAGVPTRMRQAAAVGITMSPSEAARGLLSDQTRNPFATAARASGPAPVVPPTAGVASAASAPAAASAVPSAGSAGKESASSTSAPDKISFDWSISGPSGKDREKVLSGTVVVPKGAMHGDLEDLAIRELRAAMKGLDASDSARHSYQFSAYENRESNGIWLPGRAVHMSGADPRVMSGPVPPTVGTTAKAPAASSTAATADAASSRGKPTCNWTISVPFGDGRKELASGTIDMSKRVPREANLEDLAVRKLNEATKHLDASDSARRDYQFSAYEGRDHNGVWLPGRAVHMSGADPRVTKQVSQAGGTTAKVAAARSTTVTSGATPVKGPKAATSRPVTPVRPVRGRDR